MLSPVGCRYRNDEEYLSVIASLKAAFTECMLDEVTKNAIKNFPKAFQNNTTAKIYFFVLMNRTLIFHDSLTIDLKEKSFEKPKDAFKKIFSEKKDGWKNQIKNLIGLSSEVYFILQGIGSRPWCIPICRSYSEIFGNCSSIEYCYFKNKSVKHCSPLQIEAKIKTALWMGVPKDQIQRIVDAVHSITAGRSDKKILTHPQDIVDEDTYFGLAQLFAEPDSKGTEDIRLNFRGSCDSKLTNVFKEKFCESDYE